jgi:hypothetical protein
MCRRLGLLQPSLSKSGLRRGRVAAGASSQDGCALDAGASLISRPSVSGRWRPRYPPGAHQMPASGPRGAARLGLLGFRLLFYWQHGVCIIVVVGDLRVRASPCVLASRVPASLRVSFRHLLSQQVAIHRITSLPVADSGSREKSVGRSFIHPSLSYCTSLF